MEALGVFKMILKAQLTIGEYTGQARMTNSMKLASCRLHELQGNVNLSHTYSFGYKPSQEQNKCAVSQSVMYHST